MKIIIDSYIPYIKGALDEITQVEYLSYKDINADAVKDADALIVRTRTHCDENLLKGSKVKFIASATIGYDHIDAQYCAQQGIMWTNAPGCNALSVAQYLASALSLLAMKNGINLSQLTIGVVGVGAVGSKIAKLAGGLGMKVLLNDPPRAKKEGSEQFVILDELCAEADIISFHTLLNVAGEDKTWHLADEGFFSKLKKKPVIINAARGEIVDTRALLYAIENGMVGDVILDCWEEEPYIDRLLLKQTLLATPHIAGYSADGKANAATQSVQAVSKFFDLGVDDWEVNEIATPMTLTPTDNVFEFFLQTYDILQDSDKLKNAPNDFELQRSNYPFRREPRAYLKMMDSTLRKKFEDHFQFFFT